MSMLSTSRSSPPRSSPEPDASLIAASRTEPERFAGLFRRHAPAIMRYAARRLGRDAAEDVVAETALRALAKGGVDPVTEPFTDAVESRVHAGAESRALAAAIAGLPAAQREVLLLVTWAGLTYDEVAEALGVPSGTVRSRMHRARAKLRRAARRRTAPRELNGRPRQTLGWSNPAQALNRYLVATAA